MVLDKALALSPLQRYFSRRADGGLRVLAYHDVRDAERFASHMDYITAHYQPVSLDVALAGISGEASLPERAVLVTFDDGHPSVLDVGLPILHPRGVPAVVFVVSGLLGTDHPFWFSEVEALVRRGGRCSWGPEADPRGTVNALKKVPDPDRMEAIGQLRQSAAEPAPPMRQLSPDELLRLEAGGIAIGNHTRTHPCLHRCDTPKIYEELENSQSELESILGSAPRTLAYPNGDADSRVRGAAGDLGFEAAFLFDHRVAPCPPQDALRVSRLRVNSDTTLDRFEIIVSGLHPALHRLRGRT